MTIMHEHNKHLQQTYCTPAWLVDAPPNELGALFCINATGPLVVALLTDPCSLLAPYTVINMSDALDNELESVMVSLSLFPFIYSLFPYSPTPTHSDAHHMYSLCN